MGAGRNRKLGSACPSVIRQDPRPGRCHGLGTTLRLSCHLGVCGGIRQAEWRRRGGISHGFLTDRSDGAELWRLCRAHGRTLIRGFGPGGERATRPTSQADSPISQLNPGRAGHAWDAARMSIQAASVTAGHRPETNLSRGGL